MKLFLFKNFKYAIAVGLIAITTIGCGKAKVAVYHGTKTNWDYPKTVAILPFSYDTSIAKQKLPHQILRGVFFNYFSYLGYTDIPIETVDLKISPLIKTDASIKNISNAQLMKILESDAVIRGHLINATNFTAGIYAETSIEAKLEMVDLRTGDLLWETKHMELSTSSIVTPSLIDMIAEQTANAQVDKAYHKVAESFTLKILEKIPDPASLRHEHVQLPRIISIDSNIKKNAQLHPHDVIYVSMKGDSKLDAHFDIGSYKTRIPMKEVSTGLYTGSFRLKKGDQINSSLIIGSLSNKQGLTAKKFYKKGLVFIK
jgi:hypothetical protein